MQPECRQHPTAQPEGLSKDYSVRYSRGMLTLSNYGPYKPCNPWHLSAGLVMISILGIVINLCSGAPEFCLTVVSETAEKCFLTGGSQAVDVITRKCDHKCDHLVITRSHL